MTRKHFEGLVAKAVRGIPKRLRDAMNNVAVVVEDQPTPELLKEMGVAPPDTLYGLYQGTPLPEREWAHGNVLPDRITNYQRPTVEDSAVVATSWFNDETRADVLDSPVTLEPESTHPLAVGWASVGIYTGTISNTPSVIIGEPNAHCEDWDHAAGVAYLYVDALSSGSQPVPEIFVPPHDPDNNDPIPADWNVFGWSADIVSTGPNNDNDFVIIGEPGFRAAGRVYVYQRQPVPAP